MSKKAKNSANQGANGTGGTIPHQPQKNGANGSKVTVDIVSKIRHYEENVIVTENGESTSLSITRKWYDFISKEQPQTFYVLNFENAQTTLTTAQFSAFFELAKRFYYGC